MVEQIPHRVRRRRIKGWRMPAGAIYVGRRSRWQNVYAPGPGMTRQQAVDAYRAAIQTHLASPHLAPAMRAALDELRGRDLACWCSPCDPCHADTLLVLANAPREQ